jgi:homoserine O-succinyltransferase/O-acetyltransferase
MPVIVDEYPLVDGPLAAAHRFTRANAPSIARRDRDISLTVGLVNNMPDAALETTEQQFLTLLDEAAGNLLVRVKLFAIDAVPRGERGHQHIRACYSSLRDLWGERLDGLIVTGTEPRAPDLVDEPYWAALTELFDWAQENTTTTVFSCLAAHAAVLHLHGIRRRPLAQKCFGVFRQLQQSDHPLLKGVSGRIATPHSRWNELSATDLTSVGYAILTASADAGVDMFTKQGKSLFVFLQGHPEYEAETLRREYRRDVGRFLRGEQSHYPGLPSGYFDQAATRLLQEFRLHAEADPQETLLLDFPATQVLPGIATAWRAHAVQSYRNWVAYMAAKPERTKSRRSAALWPAPAAH